MNRSVCIGCVNSQVVVWLHMAFMAARIAKLSPYMCQSVPSFNHFYSFRWVKRQCVVYARAYVLRSPLEFPFPRGSIVCGHWLAHFKFMFNIYRMQHVRIRSHISFQVVDLFFLYFLLGETPEHFMPALMDTIQFCIHCASHLHNAINHLAMFIATDRMVNTFDNRLAMNTRVLVYDNLLNIR